MKSRVAEALNLSLEPVALLWSDEKPGGAQEFQEGKWGCVMWLLAGAAKGKPAAFSRKTFGCWGGGVGLGFGNQYHNFPGGLDCFSRFLSTGNAGWEKGEAVAEGMKPHVREEFLEDFLHGEGYFSSPERVRKFVEELPMTDVPSEYVVFLPLSLVDPGREEPVVVVFPVTPDQLSALVILANYSRPGVENVIIPYAAACQTVGIFPYREAASERPRAVVGLTDISARLYVRRQLGEDVFTFTVPWKMFLQMEEDVEGSFLEKRTWKVLSGREGSQG